MSHSHGLHVHRDVATHAHADAAGSAPSGRHHHVEASTEHNRAFAFGVGLNVLFVVVEGVLGVVSGSLALVADAGHNLSDVLALLLAWAAAVLSRRAPTARRTYGYRRSSILVALANAVALFVVVGSIAWEAVHRLQAPAPLDGAMMIAVAAVGVIVNGASAALFLKGHKHDVNLRAAFLHLVSDAAVSVGVVLAGFGILLTGWVWLDPVVSLAISVVIVAGTWSVLREALDLAMDAVPDAIDPSAVLDYLASIPGVVAVHDLHIWAMSTTETALTAHLVIADTAAGDALLAQIGEELHERFEVHHATIQLERGDPAYPCILEPAHRV